MRKYNLIREQNVMMNFNARYNWRISYAGFVVMRYC